MMNAVPRRLPIETVVKRSFFFAWESRAVLTVPFLIYAAVAILGSIIIDGLDPSLGFLAVAVAEQLVIAAFAVGIHRYVLANEARPGLGFFRWDSHFLRYILLTLLLLLLVAVAAGMVLVALGVDPTAHPPELKPDPTMALIGSAALFTVSVIVSRLSLLLPAAALGDAVPARTIWQSTERNGFRLLATALLVALPFVIVDTALAGLRDVAGLALPVTILRGLVTSAQLIVITIMLSLSYDVLVRGGGPPAR
jgi:hypothetical protein